MEEKTTWGGARENAGAPQKHDTAWRKRTIVVVCDDAEWERLKALLPSDMREKYERIMNMKTSERKCPKCQVHEGEFHEFGCNIETCPWCGYLLQSCGCLDKRTGEFDEGEEDLEYAEALRIVEEKGRIPFVHDPRMYEESSAGE